MSTFLFRLVCLMVLLLRACPGNGQAALKHLTPADYHLWSKLSDVQLSANGRWASYRVYYESGADTVFVKNTNGKKMYHFAGTRQGIFFGKEKYAALLTDGRLCLMDLPTGRKQILPDVSRFEINGENGVITESASESNKSLTIHDCDGNAERSIGDVRAWDYNLKTDCLIYHAGGRLLETSTKTNGDTKAVTCIPNGNVTQFAWQENGQSAAFIIRDGDNSKIGYYRMGSGTYFELTAEGFGLNPSKMFTSTSFTPLKISKDGQKVFFGIAAKSLNESVPAVEIWNTADKVIHPMKLMLDGFENVDKAGFWETESEKSSPVTTKKLPRCMVGNDGRYALLWDPLAYQPQQKQFGDTDYYLLDMATGEKRLLLEKQTSEESQTFFSPNGKYITYYRDKQWQLYEIATGATINLTGKLPTDFEDQEYDWAGDVPPYGCAGWTAGDNAALLYDRFDLWLAYPDGRASRLTNGRETKTVFRIAPQKGVERSGINFSGKAVGSFDLSKGLWLLTERKGRKGFYKWERSGKALTLAGKNSMYSLTTSDDENAILFLEQNYNVPPKVMLKEKKADARTLFQSNPQHFDYEWGKHEIICYQNQKGETLDGILYYPSGFDAAKSYPVIVRIYEKQNWNWYEYVNPSVHNQSGYNKSNFISQGYFVFEPDISYDVGNPGLSAVDCLTAAVKSILGVPGVDGKRIGLIGNSFGGYETNMIICKSDLFAAAVSGAGISDLTTHFLCVNTNSARPNNYHFESGQFRMEHTLFEIPENYHANSPINFAENVQTPLLSWVGKDDPQVSPGQSMEFHLALRRLGKPNILLAYPNGSHAMMRRADQEDLTIKIADWFGYYLKGEPAKDWMKPDQR